MTKAKRGQFIIVTSDKHELYNEVVEVVRVVETEKRGFSGYVVAKDEYDEEWAIPHNHYSIVEEPTKQKLIKKEKWERFDKFKVKDDYSNMKQPFYRAAVIEENGVRFFDDNDEKQFLSYNSIEKIDEKDMTDLIGYVGQRQVEMEKAFKEAFKILEESASRIADL